MKNYKTYTEELNEGLAFNKYGKLQNKVVTELKLDLYFMTTFGMAITALYPLFDSLVRTGEITTSVSSTNVVLLTLCALSILFKESQSDINKMIVVIKEKNLSEILDKIINTIKNVSKLFNVISDKVGKTITGLVDMFSYTALFIPFLLGLLDVIKLYELDFSEFDQIMTDPKGASISASIGLLTISMKHIINFLMKKITRTSKNKKTPLSGNEFVQKNENFTVDKIYESYFSQKTITSCSSCIHSKLNRDGNNPYSEETIFVCLIDNTEHKRNYTCKKWQLNKNIVGKIDYCPTCGGDTYSKDWFCSVCWCDRDDSELFDI